MALLASGWALFSGSAAVQAASLGDPARLPGSFVSGDGQSWSGGIAVAPNGDLILVGATEATNLPVTDASSNAGGQDVFVARFDAKIRTLKWLVYLGGSASESAAALTLDGSGNVYLTGSTLSNDFPTASAYDASHNGSYDVFAAKLAAADGSLLWSTYLGGSGSDGASDIALDSQGRLIVVGSTASNDFPTASPFGSNSGLSDAFVTRFAANGGSLQLSSYYGINMGENAVAVGIDGEDDIYVGVLGWDIEVVFNINQVLKIDGSAKTLTWAFELDPSLVYGGSGGAVGLADIAVSDDGIVAFTGTLAATQDTLPLVNPWQAAPGGNFDFFVGKLNGAGSAITWSTYLGGSEDEESPSIALTSDGKVWVAGSSYSADYPLRRSLFATGAVVSQLSADGQNLLVSTRVAGAWYLYGLALATDAIPVLGGTGGAELAITGLLPPDPWYFGAFAARLQPLPSARFLPRSSVALPPLESALEPYWQGELDLDSDGLSEGYFELPDRSLDLAWGNVVLDRAGDGQDLVSVGIGTLGGARVVGTIDQDGDGEVELVVEDPRLDAGTAVGWLLDTGDEDVDVVVIGRGGATGALVVDLDGDGEQEVVVNAPHLSSGALARLDLDADDDVDVLSLGGLPRAILDIDDDGELEVVAERGGSGGTLTTGSLEAVSDGDVDVVFVTGIYAFSRDLDDDGIPELVVENGLATPGTASWSAPALFVGGTPETCGDVDGDGEMEVIAADGTAPDGSMDPLDLLDGGDSDADVVFVGGVFRGLVDVDGDQEAEMVAEDGGGTADTFGQVDGLEGLGDGDPDLIAVRGGAVAAADLDDDGELEIVADSGSLSLGAYSALDGAESPGDGDADVVFVGGAIATVADLDADWDAEVLAVDTSATAGTFDPLDGIESPGDGDTDVVFFSGTWRAVRDLDGDSELEAVVEDTTLGSAATSANGIEAPSDGDADFAFIEAAFLTLRDLDGDLEPEIVAEDSGVSAPSVVFTDFVELLGDGDHDLVAIPTTAGWRVADLDGDLEAELILEHSGATAGAAVAVDASEPGSSDPDVVFVGGVPQIVVDLDGDYFEKEVVVSAAIAAGTTAVDRSLESPSGDGDGDIVFVGGTARGFRDIDGDGEAEVLVENGTGGATSLYDEVDAISDLDADVVFSGGRASYFADVDADGELEAIVEDAGTSPGISTVFTGADGDLDADVIYVRGAVQGELEMDGDWELEVAITDADLASGTAVDPTGWDGDSDSDGILVGLDSSMGSPSLALVAPNGGGSVTIGNPLNITWSASGFAGTVRIELSRDGGTTWETLFANTDNDGSEVWTSDGSPTTTALIRVTSRNLATPVGDTSNATFTLI